MRNLVLIALIVMLAGCGAGGRYSASYPTCQKLAQENAKLFRWLAAHHRRWEGVYWGREDGEVVRTIARKRELYNERRAARCI